MNKPSLFIGSSKESLHIANAIHHNLVKDVEVTVWNQNAFKLSNTTIESLVDLIKSSDFAVFVFSPDDIAIMRKGTKKVVRDNVIFELGLFIGRIGRERTFIVKGQDLELKIPSDLLGITLGEYESERKDNNWISATAPVSQLIRDQVQKLGKIIKDEDKPTEVEQTDGTMSNTEIDAQDGIDNNINSIYIKLYLEKKYNEVVIEVDRLLESEKDKNKRENLLFWKVHSTFQLDPIKGKDLIVEILNDNMEPSYFGTFTSILMVKNDFELANHFIDIGLKQFGKTSDLIFRKVDYLEKLGETESAIEFLLQADYLNDISLIIKLSELYESKRISQPNASFLILLEGYTKFPYSKEILYQLAVNTNNSKPEVSLYLCSILTKQYPEVAKYWVNLGNACVNLDLQNKAMSFYIKGENLSPMNESAWIFANKGNVLNNLGFYSLAKEQINKSLEIYPDYQYGFEKMSSILKNESAENENYAECIKKGLSQLKTSIDDAFL